MVTALQDSHSAAATALQDSYVVPEACEAWLKGQIDRLVIKFGFAVLEFWLFRSFFC